MPELPEVETIVRELRNHVVGLKITGVEILDAKAIQRITPSQFRKNITGKIIQSLERRGKYLIFKLSGGSYLIIHLRMTGGLLVNPGDLMKWARVIFRLGNGDEFVFADRRRLGVVYLVKRIEDVLIRMGDEPLTGEFTHLVLVNKLKGRAAPIKAVLLDQSVVAGVGNMYADEALFKAGIHPETPAGKLPVTRVRALHRAIREVLANAIESKGASVDTYMRPQGDRGAAQDYFNVAHRRNELCKVCNTPIQRIAIRGRGTYFCPKCQK
jgi:formamidopyrimidine-DNA glycosylase